MDSCLGRLNKFMLQSDSAMSPVESEADFHDDDVDAGTFLFHDDDDVDAGTNSDWPNGAGAEPGNLTEPGAACHFCTILEAIAYGYAPDSFRSLPFPVVCLWILPSAFFTSLTVARDSCGCLHLHSHCNSRIQPCLVRPSIRKIFL